MRKDYFEKKNNDMKISVLKDQIVEDQDYEKAMELLNATENTSFSEI